MIFNGYENTLLDEGEFEGFVCLILHHKGHRNGYMRISSGHPWFGLGYDEIDALVHGGLTYSQSGTEGDEWWVGFDCAHAGDAPDLELPMDETLREIYELFNMPDDIVRTTSYVMAELESLAKQAKQAQK